MLLTAYLWILLLSGLLASGYIATRVGDSEWKLRLPVYFTVYNFVCLVLRMVMPTREAAAALNWMNPFLGLAHGFVSPVLGALRYPNETAFIAARATATLVGSTALWVVLGWVIGRILDDQARVERG